MHPGDKKQAPHIDAAALEQVFKRIPAHDIEQFYTAYQLHAKRQQAAHLQQEIVKLKKRQTHNTEQLQALTPSAISFSAIAQLRASGVDDPDLLDRMLERGEEWLDHSIQLLARCEQLNVIRGNYTQWCEHALEGAYDWMGSMSDANLNEYFEGNTHPTQTNEDLSPGETETAASSIVEVTEVQLLHKLMSEEGLADITSIPELESPPASLSEAALEHEPESQSESLPEAEPEPALETLPEAELQTLSEMVPETIAEPETPSEPQVKPPPEPLRARITQPLPMVAEEELAIPMNIDIPELGELTSVEVSKAEAEQLQPLAVDAVTAEAQGEESKAELAASQLETELHAEQPEQWVPDEQYEEPVANEENSAEAEPIAMDREEIITEVEKVPEQTEGETQQATPIEFDEGPSTTQPTVAEQGDEQREHSSPAEKPMEKLYAAVQSDEATRTQQRAHPEEKQPCSPVTDKQQGLLKRSLAKFLGR